MELVHLVKDPFLGSRGLVAFNGTANESSDHLQSDLIETVT